MPNIILLDYLTYKKDKKLCKETLEFINVVENCFKISGKDILTNIKIFSIQFRCSCYIVV